MDPSYKQLFDLIRQQRTILEEAQKQIRKNYLIQIQEIQNNTEEELELLDEQYDDDINQMQRIIKNKDNYIQELENIYDEKIEEIKKLESNFIHKNYEIDDYKQELKIKRDDNASLQTRLENRQADREKYRKDLERSCTLQKQSDYYKNLVKSQNEEIQKIDQELKVYTDEKTGKFKQMQDKIDGKNKLNEKYYEELVKIKENQGYYTSIYNETKTDVDNIQKLLKGEKGKHISTKSQISDQQKNYAKYDVDVKEYEKEKGELETQIENEETKMENLEKEKQAILSKIPDVDQYEYRELVSSSDEDDTKQSWIVIPWIVYISREKKTGNHYKKALKTQRRLLLGIDENGKPKFGDWEDFKVEEYSSYTNDDSCSIC